MGTELESHCEKGIRGFALQAVKGHSEIPSTGVGSPGKGDLAMLCSVATRTGSCRFVRLNRSRLQGELGPPGEKGCVV